MDLGYKLRYLSLLEYKLQPLEVIGKEHNLNFSYNPLHSCNSVVCSFFIRYCKLLSKLLFTQLCTPCPTLSQQRGNKVASASLYPLKCSYQEQLSSNVMYKIKCHDDSTTHKERELDFSNNLCPLLIMCWPSRRLSLICRE